MNTERDNSHRSLFDKLGVRADMHVALCGVRNETFLLELNARLAMSASPHLRGKYDLIFVQIDGPADLERIARAAAHLRPNGAIWVFHPKGNRRAAAGRASALRRNCRSTGR